MGNFTTVPDKSVGDTFLEAMWDTYLKDNLNKGVNRPLGEVILGADAASIDFTSVDQNFAHLLVLGYVRTDRATTSDQYAVRFNNDSAANYDYQETYARAATQPPAETFGATAARVGIMPGNTAGANLFGGFRLFIPYYTGAANNKTGESAFTCKLGVLTSNVFVGQEGIFWRSNAAINRLTFIPETGPNFKLGSRITIYGLAF